MFPDRFIRWLAGKSNRHFFKMSIVKNLYEPHESPVLQRLRELHEKGAAKRIEDYKSRMKKQTNKKIS